MKKIIWAILAAPGFVWWILPLVSWALGGTKPALDKVNIILMGTWPKWLGKFYKYSVGFGNMIIIHPDHINKEHILKHERVHVFQFRENSAAAAVCALYLALSGLAVESLVIWFSAVTWPAIGFGVAWLRGKRFYLDAETERSARAQTQTDLKKWLRAPGPLD